MRFLLILILASFQAMAATIHVEKTGNDTTGNGSSGAPYLTIAKAATVAAAGDTVLVGAGTYAESVWPDSASGSSGSPITFDGQNVATVQSWVFGRPYHNLINFTVTGGKTVFGGAMFVAQNGSHLIISNNIVDAEFDATRTPIIKWDGPATAPFGTAGSDNLFISNVVKNIRGEMTFRVHGYRNVITGNYLFNSDFADWFQVFGGTNYIVGNICSNLFYSGWLPGNHADFFQTFPIPGTGIGSRGHLIESNIVIRMDGLGQLGNLEDNDNDPNVQDLTFRNNIFIGIGAKMSIAMPGVKFYNNIFYNCATNTENGGPLLIFPDSGTVGRADNGQCFNNIFLNCGIAGDNRDNGSGWYVFDTTLTNVAADYNYVGKDGYQAAVVDSLHRAVGDGGGWSKWEWWEPHGINGGNPLLASESQLDFRLLPGSPLIGKALNESALFTTDIRGLTRSSWDIGPYEFQASDFNSYPCYIGPRLIQAYSMASSGATTIVWPGNPYRLELKIGRRTWQDKPSNWKTWTNIFSNTSLPSVTNAATFTDTNIAGVHYEYEVQQLIQTNVICNDNGNGYRDYEYISTGYQVPLKDTRGNVCLLVESGIASPLVSELTRLNDDLVGDGYKVFRHDVGADDVTSGTWKTNVVGIKALVQADYNTDATADWYVFIVGHVPVPYSGVLSSPGSHSENQGAHPADWYYVDFDGTWTDTDTDTSATDDFAFDRNSPGDGKFDQRYIPSAPEARIGRVDFRNMPAFGKTEVQLLRQYLDRNHAWRHKQFPVRNRAMVFTDTADTNNIANARPFGSHNQYASDLGSAYATDLGSWLTLAGSTNTSYLLAAKEGSGGVDHDIQLGSSLDFAATNLYVVFPSSYGSYYGSWDSAMNANVFMQAPLCSAGYAVATYYRENVMCVDSSAMDEPIGYELFAMAASKFAGSGFWYSPYGRVVPFTGEFLIIEQMENYESLLGDPTLRLRPVAPPSSPTVNVSGADNVVSWTASTDSNLQGYHVYRAPAAGLNSFTRLTSVPTASPFTDAGAAGTAYTYMVRAVKLDETVNRGFYSASQGVFAEASGGGGGGGTSAGVVTSGNVVSSGYTIRQ